MSKVWGRGATAIWQVEDWDADKHPSTHNYSVPSAKQVRVSNAPRCVEHPENQVKQVGKVWREAATHSQTQHPWVCRNILRRCRCGEGE